MISVVAPAWNEAVTLPRFVDETRAVLDGLGEPWELVLVDDGSADGTRAVLRELHAADARVKAVSFSRNFGHQVAITAGLDFARGDAVVVIDSDLQDPPALIPALVARWREGYQVVYAQRTARDGETWFKLATASLFYRLIRRIANVDIPVDTGDFRLLDRRAADALRGMREQHRYVRGLAAWIGFRSAAVPYQRRARHAGETKYPLRRMLKFALDGITNFSYLPLQLATYAGFLVAGLSLAGILLAIVLRLDPGPRPHRAGHHPGQRPLPGWHPAHLPGHHRGVPGAHLRRGQGPAPLRRRPDPGPRPQEDHPDRWTSSTSPRR